MNFQTWEPVYEAILADFGFERRADERARDVLADIVGEGRPLPPAAIDVDGGTVAIAGAAGTLEREADVAAGADTVLAASVAAPRLEEVGVTVDCMVTDLDKAPEAAVDLAGRGVPVVVHGHGDNIPALREWGPKIAREGMVTTTQAEPVGPVVNPGGFTDGDRAAFLADALGADELVFPGWDFEDDTVSPIKARKLRWAERLLYWLEARRGERFGVLDGRRDGIDTAALPV